jgi:hypothetical protein
MPAHCIHISCSTINPATARDLAQVALPCLHPMMLIICFARSCTKLVELDMLERRSLPEQTVIIYAHTHTRARSSLHLSVCVCVCVCVCVLQ